MPQNNKRFFTRYRIIMMLLVFAISLCGVFPIVKAYAEEITPEETINSESIIEEQAGSEEINKIQDQLKKHNNEGIQDILPGYDPQKILGDVAKGKFQLSVGGILEGILRYVFKEVYVNMHILIKIVILVILCSVLKNLQTAFLSESVGELAFYACYVVIVSLMIVSVSTVLGYARDIIDSLVSFMHATIPVMITLLVSGGNITSAGVFQPVLIMLVEVSATIFKNVFIPLIFLSVILSVVDNISEKVQVSRLAQFLKQVSGWSLGLVLTIFIGILGIQGSLGAVVDGVTSKTAKFAIGALVPVAGKYLADAADAVIGCTLLIKNASGIVVMLGIVAICIIPLIKIFAILVLYRITCILVEPIAEKRITNCINEMANAITFAFGIAASVTFMFLLSVTAIIGASNISAMMR